MVFLLLLLLLLLLHLQFEACENRKMRTLALPAYDLAPELGNEDSARTILNAISAYFTQQKARSSITTLHVCNDIFGAFVKCLLAEASQPNTCISMDESNESYAFMADLELSDDDEYDDDIVDADGFYLGRTTRYAELSSSDDDDDDFNYTFDYPESLPSLGLLDLHEERGASPDGVSSFYIFNTKNIKLRKKLAVFKAQNILLKLLSYSINAANSKTDIYKFDFSLLNLALKFHRILSFKFRLFCNMEWTVSKNVNFRLTLKMKKKKCFELLKQGLLN